MSTKSKRLVALLGGRLYKDSLTLRLFLTPPVRKRLAEQGIDFIIATNNPNAADQFEQIKSLKVVRTSPELHESFMARQREEKPNLGAETRETINQYAIENGYDYVLHLDDNIKALFYYYNGKNRAITKNRSQAFYHIMMLLFDAIELTNSGAVGICMSAFAPSHKPISFTAGFPYSFFTHRVDKNFVFENSTEDDIIMSIYNGEQGKPSSLIRNSLFYGKTGKKEKKDGNRKLYQAMLKENKRGEYIFSKWPEIYERKVSWNVKSSTKQKEPMLQHKHTLRKPKDWNEKLKYDPKILELAQQTVDTIARLERAK